MKLTQKQIYTIIANTPEPLKGSQHFSTVETLGYYQKAGANWRYNAVYIDYNGARALVVKQFGEIL